MRESLKERFYVLYTSNKNKVFVMYKYSENKLKKAGKENESKNNSLKQGKTPTGEVSEEVKEILNNEVSMTPINKTNNLHSQDVFQSKFLGELVHDFCQAMIDGISLPSNQQVEIQNKLDNTVITSSCDLTYNGNNSELTSVLERNLLVDSMNVTKHHVRFRLKGFLKPSTEIKVAKTKANKGIKSLTKNEVIENALYSFLIPSMQIVMEIVSPLGYDKKTGKDIENWTSTSKGITGAFGLYAQVFGLERLSTKNKGFKSGDSSKANQIGINPITKESFKFIRNTHENSILAYGDKQAYIRGTEMQGYQFTLKEKMFVDIFKNSSFDAKTYIQGLLEDEVVQKNILTLCNHEIMKKDGIDSYVSNTLKGERSKLNNKSKKDNIGIRIDRVLKISYSYLNPNHKTGNKDNDTINETKELKTSDSKIFDFLDDMFNGRINKDSKYTQEQASKIADEILESLSIEFVKTEQKK